MRRRARDTDRKFTACGRRNEEMRKFPRGNEEMEKCVSGIAYDTLLHTHNN